MAQGSGNRVTPRQGENNTRSILKEDDVIEILASGEKAQVLAERYGVKASTIYAIRTGSIWYYLRRNPRKSVKKSNPVQPLSS